MVTEEALAERKVACKGIEALTMMSRLTCLRSLPCTRHSLRKTARDKGRHQLLLVIRVIPSCL